MPCQEANMWHRRVLQAPNSRCSLGTRVRVGVKGIPCVVIAAPRGRNHVRRRNTVFNLIQLEQAEVVD